MDLIRNQVAKVAEPEAGNIKPLRRLGYGLVDNVPPLWESTKKRAEWIADLVKDYIPLNATRDEKGEFKKSKVLDVGSGIGLVGLVMEENKDEFPGVEVINLDPFDINTKKVQREMAELRGAENPKNINVNNAMASALALPLPSECFDAVMFNFVLHHLSNEEEQKAALREAMRVLGSHSGVNPETQVITITEDILTTEKDIDVTKKVDRRLNTELDDGKHNYHTIEEWKRIFNEVGLELTNTNQFETQQPEGTVHHAVFVLKKKPVEEVQVQPAINDIPQPQTTVAQNGNFEGIPGIHTSEVTNLPEGLKV